MTWVAVISLSLSVLLLLLFLVLSWLFYPSFSSIKNFSNNLKRKKYLFGQIDIFFILIFWLDFSILFFGGDFFFVFLQINWRPEQTVEILCDRPFTWHFWTSRNFQHFFVSKAELAEYCTLTTVWFCVCFRFWTEIIDKVVDCTNYKKGTKMFWRHYQKEKGIYSNIIRPVLYTGPRDLDTHSVMPAETSLRWFQGHLV